MMICINLSLLNVCALLKQFLCFDVCSYNFDILWLSAHQFKVNPS